MNAPASPPTSLTRYAGRRITMYVHLTDESLRFEVRDRYRSIAHDRQLARLLAARRWDRRAAAASRRARALRAG